MGAEAGGVGELINTSMRGGGHEPVILVLLIIPVVALGIDWALFWVQRELFPHRFGGMGILNQAVTTMLHGAEDVKGVIFRRSAAAAPDAAGDSTRTHS